MRNVRGVSLGFTIVLILILTLLYHAQNRELSYPTRLLFSSSDKDINSTRACISIPLPTIPKQRETKELWNHLQTLFKEHAPAQRLSPGEFP